LNRIITVSKREMPYLTPRVQMSFFWHVTSAYGHFQAYPSLTIPSILYCRALGIETIPLDHLVRKRSTTHTMVSHSLDRFPRSRDSVRWSFRYCHLH